MTKIVINGDRSLGTINKNIYGHFSEHLGRCIYQGIWVGEDSEIPNIKGMRTDVLTALQELQIPVLRWPGGCFADEYHWKDGVGPRDQRPRMVNTHWGGVVENNHFGTHEFLELCEMIGAQPYICGNVGSGTVHEMQQWVEYMTFDGESPMAAWRQENGREQPWQIPYFGVGNENWGCGGHMRPEYYADLYRRYATYVRNFGGNRIAKIACGANDWNVRWTEVLMREAGRLMNGLSLHYYTVCGDWRHKGSATDFTEADWFVTLKKTSAMDEIITRHSAVMDHFDPEGRVGLVIDEWGTWYDVEPGTNPGFLYQQNTMRDALVAAINFTIFHKHCNRVQMANIAQLINVLQAVLLTTETEMIKTPTYHVFNMYKVHQDAQALDLAVTGSRYEHEEESLPQAMATASLAKDGNIHVSLCNLHPHSSAEVTVELRGAAKKMGQGTILTADKMNAHNTFAEPDTVCPRAFNGVAEGPESLKVQLPPMSVVTLQLN